MKQIVSFPTQQTINLKTKTLDQFSRLIPYKKNCDIFIKMDIEGHEIDALKGAEHLLSRYLNITLLIEDSVMIKSEELYGYLMHHFDYMEKLTTYNSFWKLKTRT